MKCLSNDTLIISNFSDDSISIIDLVLGKEVKRIKLHYNGKCSSSLQFGPHHIALDYKGEFLYVPNSWHNSISIVDLVDEKIVDTIFVGSCPSQVIICPKYKTIYVANTDSNSISILCMDSFKLMIQIPTGQMPHGMAITNDQERIFIGNYGSDEITEISTRTHKIVKTHKVECSPWHLRLDKSGDFLIIVNYADGFEREGKVLIYDTKLLKEVKSIVLGKMLVEAISDKNNEYLYATDSDMDCVHVYNLKENEYSHKICVSPMPHGINLDNKGLLFITSLQKNRVDIIDINKRKVIKSIPVGKEPTSILKNIKIE